MKNRLRTLALLLVAVVFNSGCSSDDNLSEFETLKRQIVGKWELEATSGGILGLPETPVDYYQLREFTADGRHKLFVLNMENNVVEMLFDEPYELVEGEEMFNNEGFFYLDNNFATRVSMVNGRLILDQQAVDGLVEYYTCDISETIIL